MTCDFLEGSVVAAAPTWDHEALRRELLASDHMKARCDRLANSTDLKEGDQVWLHCLSQTIGKSPKVQSSWEGRYIVIFRISGVVYLI